jgi:hypothetical protein
MPLAVNLRWQLSSQPPHVIDFARDVRVVPHHHLCAGVAQQLGEPQLGPSRIVHKNESSSNPVELDEAKLTWKNR